jgi:hypothetical protein
MRSSAHSAQWASGAAEACLEQYSVGCGTDFAEQVTDVGVDLIADAADDVEGLACGVGQIPVEVALAGIDGAGISASHGDHDVRGADGLIG